MPSERKWGGSISAAGMKGAGEKGKSCACRQGEKKHVLVKRREKKAAET